MDKFVVKRRKVDDEKRMEQVQEKGIDTQPCTSASSGGYSSVSQDEVRTPADINLPVQPVQQSSLSRDLGTYLGGMSGLSEHIKYELLTNHYIPPKDYIFPSSVHLKKGREEHRRVNSTHFNKYPWLVFSENKQGLFCKYCAIFCYQTLAGGQKTVPLKKLVSEPLKKYAKLTEKDGDLETHSSSNYHKVAEQDAQSFIFMYQNPKNEVINLLDESRKKQVTENRSRLIPIIKTILLHGKQNIPLRGHRDDGSLSELDDDPVQNEGNFRALLRFRVDSGDTELESHLTNVKSNATYISKTTANELIQICGEEIILQIKKRVSEAKYYSIIFDETTDISHTSQLSLSLRYVYNGCVREDFVGFIDVHKTNFDDTNVEIEPTVTGQVLGKTVLTFMTKLALNPKYCVGIGCDGCSVNISTIKGAVAEIKQEAAYSSLCICQNHALNLTLSKSSKVQSVRNALGTIKEVAGFFTASAKRNHVLKKVLGHTIRSYCETRWVERHDTVLEFQEDLPKIKDALEIVSRWEDSATASKANALVNSISNCEFVVTVYSLSDILSSTVILSKYLQDENIDMAHAKEKLDQAVNTLSGKRKGSDALFSLVFDQAEKTMDTMEVDVKIPRIAKRQMNRANYQSSSESTNEKEDIVSYWRKSVYIPILDHVLSDLKERFSEDAIECFQMNFLLPAKHDSISDVKTLKEVFEPLCKKFSGLISQSSDTMVSKLINEIHSLKNSSGYSSLRTISRAIEVYNKCDSNAYPLLKTLLQTLLSLPISAATAERSFSTLRRVKTWTRSRMTEDRLTGLALLYVHRDIAINIDNVVNNFASKKSRRVDFVV